MSGHHPLQKDFLQAMRGMAATVSVVATHTETRRFGITVSSVTSVSLAPASLLVCINQNTAIYPCLAVGQRLSFNVLRYAQAEIAQVFAGAQTGDERFNTGDWRQEADGSPYLADAQAVIWGRIAHCVAHGTHGIVIVNVEQVQVGDAGIDPLLYADGAYTRLP